MPYKLKANCENFTVMDGSFAGRQFKRGEVYGEIPPEETAKFDEIQDEMEKRGKGEAEKRKTSQTSAPGPELNHGGAE